jgi:hypothetical protein
MFMSVLANRMQKCLIAFLKPNMSYKQVFWSRIGATDGFSKASWGVYTDFQVALEIKFVPPMQLYNSC